MATLVCVGLSAAAFGQVDDVRAIVPPDGAGGFRFEQDADVRNGTLAGDNTDWAAADGGLMIIDNLDFIANPLFPGLGDERLILSTGFNALLYRDANVGSKANPETGGGSDHTQFQGTSNKNDDLIGDGQSPWTWGNGSGMPQKNDLTNTYLYSEFDAWGHLWLMFGYETRSTNGDSYGDVEWNSAGLSTTGETSGYLIGNGTEGGRTAGDFIISIDFENGGAQPTGSFRVWNGASYGDPVDPPADSVYLRTVTEDEALAEYGSLLIPGGPWGHFNSNGSDSADNHALQMVEGAVDLTALDVVPVGGGDDCFTNFVCSAGATVQFKTRSSQSFTAELKDLVLVPFPLAPTPEAAIVAPPAQCPGATFEVTATETTGLPDPLFEWEIVSGPGTIVGDPTGATVTVQADELACDDEVALRVVVTVGPCCGATETTVTVEDFEAPEISGQGPDMTIPCTEEPVFTAPTASDLCDPSPTVRELSDETTPGDCPQEYVRTKTWDAIDACGNASAPVSQTITVVDELAPEISGQGPDTTIPCTEEPVFTAPIASDLCDPDPVVRELSDETIPGDCPQEYVRIKTWDAIDACGNVSAPVSQTITVVDELAPEISGQGPDTTIPCTEEPVFTAPIASDLCDPDPVVRELSDETIPGDCPQEYVRTKTWDAIDACGNVSAPVSQTITVVDELAPEISGQGPDTTIPCTEEPVFTAPVASDLCDPDPVVRELSDETIPGDCPQEYVRIKTWDAIDACGNVSAPVSQTITVVDELAPEISGQGPDMTIPCTEELVFTAPVASDLCDPDPVVRELSDETIPGDCPQEYVRIKTWDAMDACGNVSAPVSQTITVVDDLAPVITVFPEEDMVLDCGEEEPFAVEAEDNCGEVTLSFEWVADNPGCVELADLGGGLYSLTLTCTVSGTVTFTAEDECGNVSDPRTFGFSAECGQACSPGFWRHEQHFVFWCEAGYNPVDDYCDPSTDATLFVDAFGIMDFSSTEIPESFDEETMTLLAAVNMSGGSFKQALFHGTAALLNAAHPDVGFPEGVDYLQGVMQDAFAGVITFAEAHGIFAALNAVESEGGCPLSGGGSSGGAFDAPLSMP